MPSHFSMSRSFVTAHRRCRHAGIGRGLWLALPLLVASVSCSSQATTSVGPTLVKCSVASPSPVGPGPAAGGPVSLAVSARPEGAWTATSGASWISEVSPAAGQGDGQIQVKVAANTETTARQTNILLNSLTIRLSQEGARVASPVPSPPPPPGSPAPAPTPTPAPGQPAPGTCTFAVTPSVSLPAAGGAVSIDVNAGSGCTWTAVSSASWITIDSGSSGTGSGVVAAQVDVNSGPARTGTIAIAGEVVTIWQAAACSFSVAPTLFTRNSLLATGLTIQVTAGPGCSWTAVSHDSWIDVTSGAAGSGNGSVVFGVGLNLGAPRTGTLTVAGVTVTVQQDRLRLLP